MKIMFDCGSTKSFIQEDALRQTHHLPINSQRYYCYMADGISTFEIIGTVKIFVKINELNTSIIAGVVKSLCVDCLLGMDYINKYQVNLNNKRKQIEIFTYNNTTTINMNEQLEDVRVKCRLYESTIIYPYQEKQVQITAQVSQGQMFFSPVIDALQRKGLIIPNSLISISNYRSAVYVYNPNNKIIYLNKNFTIGMITPFTSSTSVSPIFDSKTRQKFDDDQRGSVTPTSEYYIDQLISHLTEKNQVQVKVMLKKHHRLFDIIKTTIADTTTPHEICTGDNPPPSSRPYPQTTEKQKATFDIIQQMLLNKQIRTSHSQYAAPILLVKKRDGSYRFVVDYRKLNNITIPDRYPLPNLEQTIQVVGGHQYYTKLDLRAGYFQIPIREDDKHKTAFITVHGLYEFNVLAQGLKNSPPSFQRIMANLLLPCKSFCLVYLDDVLIYSNNFEQHVQHVNQVLAIFNKHKFQLNPEKCELIRTTIDYLGHTINAQGIKPLQERIEKILAIPQPTTLNQANAFIGAIGWYRKFIKDYTKIAAPILAVTNLTVPHRNKFKWGEQQRTAFDALKTAIMSEPLFLDCPDVNAPLILATDASDKCIGGVLYQESDGIRKNIYFYSQMLPKSQQKWPTIEKEALAIYYCVTRMKLFLLGREFIIQTDHCPLRDMHTKPSNNRRVDRISLVLQQYNIKEIRHIAGKCNCMADYLSRYPCQIEDDDEFLDSDFGFIPGSKKQDVQIMLKNESFMFGNVGAVMTRAQTRAQVQNTLNVSTNIDDNDDEIPVDDHPPRKGGHEFDVSSIAVAQKNDPSCQEKRLEINKNTGSCSYELVNDVLFKIVKRGMFSKKLIYIPKVMIQNLLNVYHDSSWASHFGFRRTYMKIKDRYWWPDMKNNILNYIQACKQCQQFNVDRRKSPGLLNLIEPPSGPFQLIGVDYSGPFPATPEGNQYVLAITDYFTKWIIAIPLPNQTAATTAKALYEHYICIYGVPKRMLTDQGSHFNNQLMQAFTKLLGCHHIKSTPYHPQTNGAIERFNSTFERQIAKVTDTYINNWDVHLSSVVFAYNTGQHATTNYSPFQLQFGRSPALPPDKQCERFEFHKPNDYFKHLQETIKLYHGQAVNNMKKRQQNYKMQYDQNRMDIHYKIGDYVFKKLPGTPSKLSAIYSNPMMIIKKEHPTYWIEDPDTRKIHQVHVSQVKRCIPCDLNLSSEQ